MFAGFKLGLYFFFYNSLYLEDIIYHIFISDHYFCIHIYCSTHFYTNTIKYTITSIYFKQALTS